MEWHPHRMALQGSKAKAEENEARRDLVQSAVSHQDPGAESQKTKRPGNHGGTTASSNGQQRLQPHMRSMSLSGKEATGQVPALCAVLDSK